MSGSHGEDTSDDNQQQQMGMNGKWFQWFYVHIKKLWLIQVAVRKVNLVDSNVKKQELKVSLCFGIKWIPHLNHLYLTMEIQSIWPRFKQPISKSNTLEKNISRKKKKKKRFSFIGHLTFTETHLSTAFNRFPGSVFESTRRAWSTLTLTDSPTIMSTDNTE